MSKFTNASRGERSAAGRQHKSLESPGSMLEFPGNMSRYVWQRTFWTLYTPRLSFVPSKIYTGGLSEETVMAAGNNGMLTHFDSRTH